MSEQELIEALARRMAHVTHANPSYPEHIYDEDWELYVDAAKEAVRQMEWARSEGMDDDRDKPYAVTLAPPDWKP